MENNSFNYVVTAQKPTAVTHSVTGNFTAPNETNLIVCKTSRIELYVLTPEGVQPLLDVPIYGRVAVMKLFRPKNETQDLLFICLERLKFAVLAFDPESGEIVTRAGGDLADKVGRRADIGALGAIDPQNRLIGMHLYDGMLKVVPMDDTGALQEAFNLRLEETDVVDIAFLDGCKTPTLLVLYQDVRDQRHLKTYCVSVKDKEFQEGPWSQNNVEMGASMLVPVPSPLGGAIIIGEQTITYHYGSGFQSINMPLTIIKTVEQLDDEGHRFLMADHVGNLLALMLVVTNNQVTDLKLEVLGETTCLSTISYLDNSFVYCGSKYGDSHLIKLHSEPDEIGSFVEPIREFNNIGPVLDFCVVDLERQGQGQVVTCSGAFKDGSLRIIQSGIGLASQATMDVSGVKGIWSLRDENAPPKFSTSGGGNDGQMDTESADQDADDVPYDKYLVISFLDQTHVMAIGAEDDTVTFPGFLHEEQTLLAADVCHQQILQVTANKVVLVDCKTHEKVAEYVPDDGKRINVVDANFTQIALGISGGLLVYLQIGQGALELVKSTVMENEISCVNIHSISSDLTQSTMVAVGTWTDMSVRLLDLPNLQQLLMAELDGEYIARSILMIVFEGVPYLMVALGDGHLVTFVIDIQEQALTQRKKVSLATQPITLTTFNVGNVENVFASSDRPTVIYGSSRKLQYSNVNLSNVTNMCSFDSEAFPDTLAVTTEEEGLIIGSIDDIQKLHIQTIHLEEMPRRICHQRSSNTFAVLTVHFNVDSNEETDHETSYVKLLDDQTFDILHDYQLDSFESACSVISGRFGEDEREYFVVGTAYVLPKEENPTRGRLLLFYVQEGRLTLAAEKDTSGAVYSLTEFNGKVLAGINSKVELNEITDTEDGGKQIRFECSHHGNVLVLEVKSRGDFIIVGDLMKSIALLKYNEIDGVIEELSRDHNPSWVSCIEFLGSETYIGGENSYNFYSVMRNTESVAEEDRSRLDTVGEFHLGDFVNRFRHGSLVMRLDAENVKNNDNTTSTNKDDMDQENADAGKGDASSSSDGDSSLKSDAVANVAINGLPTLLFGTVNGSLGAVISLPKEQFVFLQALEKALQEVIPGVGGFSHKEWRSFRSERKTTPAHGFIDGDLIEMFLDLPTEKMQSALEFMGADHTVEEICALIEELTRLH
eukprot:TRINITY_DN380_c1_g1_i2.p1 TRINITY_DN380_c1_g1~~TRINITY_DN380_c1_g1_i2.p1  ORF type:complete len:1241 (+),score=459.79 TRINITY_DN380_c1_g1_i2:225-3725(+)